MVKVWAIIDDKLNLRLKTYLLGETGKLREGQSDLIARAIEHELDRLEEEARTCHDNNS